MRDYLSFPWQGQAAMRPLLLLICIFLLSGCLSNSAKPIDHARGSVSPGRAVIIVGIADEHFIPGQSVVAAYFDQFSLEDGRITGDCFRYNRLAAELTSQQGIVRYFAFDAPPGHYVLSPFVVRRIDQSARAAFNVPGGSTTYLGDFVDTGENERTGGTTVVRRENLPAATAFARSLGLTTPPVIASATPLDGFGAVFLCTP